jgi:Fe-Mn family superoxide dismutase
MRASRCPQRIIRLLYKLRSSLTVEVSQVTLSLSVSYRLFIIATGHINHTLFWKNLAPVKEGGGKLEDGKFKDAIVRDFGSVERFKKQFNAATVGIQGSGWGWLGSNPTTNILDIVTTPNQDHLL